MTKDPEEKVAYRRLKREPKLARRDFWSWLQKSDIPEEKKRELFAMTQAHPLIQDPQSGLDLFARPATKVKELLEWLEKYLEWLRSTPYTVIIQNGTTDTFSDVVWAFQLRDGTVDIQVQNNLSPGAFFLFRYESCLQMIAYAFSIYVGNVEMVRSPTMSIGEINTIETQVHGQFAMCDDSWVIVEEYI